MGGYRFPLEGVQVPGGELHSSPEIFLATFQEEFLQNFSRVAETEHNTQQSTEGFGCRPQDQIFQICSSLFIFCSSTTSQFHTPNPLPSAGVNPSLACGPRALAGLQGSPEKRHHLCQSHSAWQETNHSLSTTPSISESILH